MEDLVKMLKKSIGVMDDCAAQDDFYELQLTIAKADLMSDDITESVIATDMGKTTLVIYAQKLIEGVDIATNSTILFLRNKLSNLTKGVRYADGKETSSPS